MSETFSVLVARAQAAQPWRSYSDICRDLGSRRRRKVVVIKSRSVGKTTDVAPLVPWYLKD